MILPLKILAAASLTAASVATGGVIVTLQTLLFLAAFYFAPKHGVIAARRRPAEPSSQGAIP